MTHFTTSPGVRIAYDVTGSGPALVLLHGGANTRSVWREYGYVDRLQRNFTVITVDRRGSGESDRPTDTDAYDIRTLCADVHAVATD